MSCSWCEARLAPLVDGDLAPRERALVVAHVRACARCAGVLEELRVVDALLLTPSDVRLAPNFTFATMAEVRDLPPPCPMRTPLVALCVCYLVASWLLLAAALVLSPQILRAAGATAVDAVRTLVEALGGIGHLFVRVVGWSFVADVVLALGALAVLRRARPAIAERLRW